MLFRMGDCIITLFVLSTHSSFSSYLPKSNGNTDLFYKKVFFRISTLIKTGEITEKKELKTIKGATPVILASHLLIFYFRIPVNINSNWLYPLIGTMSLKRHFLKRLNHCMSFLVF